MLKQLQQLFTRQSKPRADANKSLMLWAVLGFVAGFSPIIIFLVFVPATKSDKPSQEQGQQTIAANKQSLLATAKTVSALPPTATTDQPLPASQAQPANTNEHTRKPEAAVTPAAVQAQETKLSVVTPTPVTPTPALPVSQKVVPKSTQAAPATAEANKAVAIGAPTIRKHTAEKTALKNKPQKEIKHEPRTRIAAVIPAKPSAAAQPERSAGIEPRPENTLATVRDTIVYQRWEQNSPESIFPAARVIECSTDKEGIVCWTDVLTGKHNSRNYRYKVKMILDKFSADKQFVMTYRDLILSSGTKSPEEEAGGLGALPEKMKPGWAPMINRLPCQLASYDKIVCSPVGETQFVLKGTEVQTSSRR